MAPVSENYLILSKLLRKMEMDENYQPTDSEIKVVTSLLEKEDRPSHRRKRKEVINIQRIVHDRLLKRISNPADTM